jgi:hypothetical protein
MSTTIYEAFPAVSGLPSPVSSAAAADAQRVLISCEDGSLRAFEARDDPLTSSRPSYALSETVSRFTADRKAARALRIVPRWRALLSLSGASAFAATTYARGATTASHRNTDSVPHLTPHR